MNNTDTILKACKIRQSDSAIPISGLRGGRQTIDSLGKEEEAYSV